MIVEVIVREETHRVYHIEANTEEEARKKIMMAISEGKEENLELESEYKEFNVETSEAK